MKDAILRPLRAGSLVVVIWAWAMASAHAQTFIMADGANWETCTGTFYDSGGAGSNYASNENMTATLCPSGGPGSGPQSKVTFTDWNVQLGGLLDVLVIHNGPTAAGAVLGTGSGLFSLQGQTFTSTDPSGCLTFVWTSDLLLTSGGWVADISTGPSDGGDASTSVCSNGAPVDLFPLITGSPTPGGAWTFGGNPVTSIYTPGTSAPGVYTYTVAAVPPCASAVATVTVGQVAAPNAGISHLINVCSNEPAFSMRGRLLGTPQAGGTWTNSSNVVHIDQFNPGTETSETFTYTVTGTNPCANATATLTITVVPAPQAGTNGSITVCSNGANVDLFSLLGGSPASGGTWTDPSSVAHGSQLSPGTDPPGIYTYSVAGQAPCAPATATVTVTINAAPNAGTSASVTKCSNAASFTLFSQLLGTPQQGGTWTAPDNSSLPWNFQFLPASSAPGTYTYTRTGTAPCAPATATVNVAVVTAPSAGTNGTRTVCSIDGAFALFGSLGGTPNGGGSWTDPLNAPVPSGQFVPGSSVPGIYTYTVVGTAPCANATATVTVTQVAAANAGTNGSVTLCSNSPVDTLFVHLGGSPSPGGTWSRPGGASFSGLYNPANVNHLPGTYIYTVGGTTPCPNAQASVVVFENQAPVAGSNGSIALCSTSSVVNLINSLGGNPSGTGTWRDPLNQPFDGSFDPATDAAGIYKYIVTGTSPCVNDTGFVTVSVNQAPDAGLNGSLNVCGDGGQVALFGQLTGSPDPGGTWTDPNNGTSTGNYLPGTNALEGAYTYHVAGVAPCASASAVVTVNEERLPVAGGNGSVTLCSTEPPLNLLSRLSGTPDAGGTWTPGNANGLFTPGTSAPGTYTYTVTGVSPCPNATATVAVTVNQAPYAGENGVLTVCADQVSVDLFTGLGGTPSSGGTWSDDDNTLHLSGQFFTPVGMPPGTYHFTYTVPANGQCAADQATVSVIIVSQLNAGTNGSVSICRTETSYNLLAGLGGNPQSGGVWTDLDNGDQVVSQFFNAHAGAPGVFHFRYTLTGTVGCATASAQTTVTVVAEPHAGDDGTLPICSTSGPANMFDYINNEQPGGNWRFNNQNHNSTYNPPIDVSGNYYYIKTGMAPCLADTAVLVVTETTALSAGTPASITRCATDASFNMTLFLGGTPAPNGTWTSPFPFLQPHSSTFVPGFDPAGAWTYTVAAAAPCPNGVAQLTITINQPANAGNGSDTTVCGNGDPFLLFTRLSGNPQFNGTWYGPNGMPCGNTYDPPDEDGTYTYVTTRAFCPNDTSFVTIFENEPANAGVSDDTTLCLNGGEVSLLMVLNGSPDPAGSWTGPNNSAFDGTFTPGSDQVGSYHYSVAGLPPCAAATSTVTVGVNEPPDAGISTSIAVCSSQSPFTLRPRLGGTPDATGTWTDPHGDAHDGIFSPLISLPGVYTYTVEGDDPCADAVATVTVAVSQSVNAGSNGSLTLCSTSGATNMFPSLGGSPQLGGTWKDPLLNAHSSSFVPSVDAPGNYTYTVTGAFPCPSASAVVSVSVNTAPQAGSNGLITVCSNSNPVILSNSLGGSPGIGGTWTDPHGDQHTGVYVPGTDDAGPYTYTIVGVQPCATSSAQVTVFENPEVDAGTNGAISVCSDDPSFPLIDVLEGTPDVNGVWTDPQNAPFGGTYDPLTAQGGVYTYFVDGATPCIDKTATATITRNTAPRAGVSTARLVCSSSGPLDLIDLLAGTPDLNGTWMGPGGVPHSQVFDPAVDLSGTYTYRVPGFAPCDTALATVQITLSNAPNAGSNGAITACSGENDVQLFAGLHDGPQIGGTWVDVDNTNHVTNGSFNTVGMALGNYHFTYVVSGSGPCAADSATVTVTVTDALDAGNDATSSACLSQGDIVLFNLLGGTPQPGGTWSDGSNGIFDPSDGVGVYDIDYVLPGSSGCVADTATVHLTVLLGPRAGNDGSGTYCAIPQTINLFTVLGGSFDNNGTWYDPDQIVVQPPTIDPSVDAAGVYIYVVPAIGACAADTARATIQITQPPNAGTPGTLSVCNNGGPVNLFLSLNGTPSYGGTWRGPNALPHDSIYNPQTDNPGFYTYTVPGQGACSPASAAVLVTENQAPDAGLPNTIPVCSAQASFQLFTYLAGGPQTGGSWIDPEGNNHGPTFNPAEDAGGAYTYIITGVAPCTNDSSVLTINLTTAPDAGSDSTLNVCASTEDVNLFLALGAGADPNGTWVDVNSSGQLEDSLFHADAVPLGTYHFTYTVAGSGPCLADVTTLTVNVGSGADPGIGGDITICGGAIAYDLFNALTGTPDLDGEWVDGQGTGALTGNLLNASVLTPGSPYGFSYSVTDPGCGEATALVTITVTPYPDPGGDTTVAVCNSSGVFNLFDMLRGTPDTGGAWTDQGGVPVDNIFDPSSDPSGAYVYHLSGTAPCGDTTATVIVSVNVPASAGSDGSIASCDAGVLDLVTGLSPDATIGGIFRDDEGSGALEGSIVDLAQLSLGAYHFSYVVVSPGCGSDTALITLNVVEGIRVIDTLLVCDQVYRTYTVQLTVQGGDPSTYYVQGLVGTFSTEQPWVFTSEVLFTNQPFSATVDDSSHCSPTLMEGVSPCHFDDDVFVPESFTPNGDLHNDTFVIPGVEGYPDNRISIFNRWGGEVYSAAGYNNHTVVWDGTSTHAVIEGDLPTGTYFYVLELGNGTQAYKGFVYLNR